MAGTIPVALSQQIDSNGKPLVGALLYIYVVGTVSQPQIAFQDTGLSRPLPWPVPADANGRLPMFYLADGAVAVKLVDANGGLQFSYPNMLVIGPSGGTAPGPGVDPTTIFQPGDIKFRPTAETLSGWTKMNGQTIGSAGSGASGRANADTQAQFIYLWTEFAFPTGNVKCPVIGGLGVSALADFNANKQITTLDWRGRGPKGLDDMGNAAAGTFTNVPFSGDDTATTPGGLGGENAHTMTVGEAPAGQITMAAEVPHSHGLVASDSGVSSNPAQYKYAGGGSVFNTTTATASTGLTLIDHAGGTSHNTSELFQLGTWYMRL